MTQNPKASKFRNRSVKDAVAQSDQAIDVSMELRQIVQNQSVALLDLVRKNAVLTDTATRADAISQELDFRVLALIELLSLSHEAVDKRVQDLKLAQFDRDMVARDARENLEVLPADALAEAGNIAVITVRLFKDGAELSEHFLPRQRFLIGGGELLPEIDQAVVGLKAGEARKFPVDLQGRTDEGEVTLLTLRKQPSVQETQTTDTTSAQQ